MHHIDRFTMLTKSSYIFGRSAQPEKWKVGMYVGDIDYFCLISREEGEMIENKMKK